MSTDANVVTITQDTNTPAAPVTLPSSTTRPDNVPEKFWDAEKGAIKTDEVLRSYTELERKIGGQKAPEATPETPAQTPPADEKVAEQLAQQGIDYAALQDEFVKNGSLSEETVKALSAKGVTKEMVDDFVAGKQAQASEVRSFALEGVGDKKFGEAVEWAKANLTPADIEAYNKLVNTAQSKDDARAAVANLMARYEQANGSEPSLLNIKGMSPAADVYKDLSQMQADMADPRYGVSEAFRSQVAAKLSRSSIM